MKNVIKFLEEVRLNNNRLWFEANKEKYKVALAEFNGFVEELIAEVGAFDSDIKGLTLKDCTYRIYRDVRFSKNKEPYKTHMGAYLCRGGKKSGYSGYYFHIEPEGDGLLGRSMMTSGMYMPEPKVLKSIREEILDNGDEMVAAIKKAKGFTLGMSGALKKTPTGFPAGTPHDDLLRLKDIYLTHYVDNAFLTAPNLAQRVAAEFKKTYEFNSRINRAVQYAYEEM